MSRIRTLFFCTECGNDTPRWQGQCPACSAWNTLIEERQSRTRPAAGSAPAAGQRRSSAQRIAEIEGGSVDRWSAGIAEFDFVLGGGIVPGSVVLVGGEPGIGKSTLLLQIAARLTSTGRSTLYVSGEESAMQVRLRAQRLEEITDEVLVLPETELETILARSEKHRPELLLIDSIQTVFSNSLEGVPGSIAQVRECAVRLQRYAKESGTTVFLVGHVTKGGGIAGPKTLEHIVDTVLYFESAGGAEHRVLRATKNRFGGVDEIGVFRMSARGLVPVANPSELFLGDRQAVRPGCAVTAAMEGSRPLLVEIQALAARASYGAPQRVAAGFDHKRLALLLAVLEKRAGLPFGQLDVFLNVVGGFRVVEPAADSAVAVALASTVRDHALSPETLLLGEIGLGGEVRPVSQLDRRLAEAARMGFTQAFVPARSNVQGNGSIRVREVSDLSELLEVALA